MRDARTKNPIELDPSRIVVNRSVKLGNPVHSFISTHPGVPPDPMKLHEYARDTARLKVMFVENFLAVAARMAT